MSPARRLVTAIFGALVLASTIPTSAAGATALRTTTWQASDGSPDSVELDRFPAPLEERPLLVHDGSATGEQAALEIAAAYGTRPEIVDAADLVDGLAGRDLVVLGGAADEVAPDLTDHARAVSDGTDRFDAVLTIGPSPFDAMHEALVVVGSDDGITTAARILADPERVAQLRGRTAAVVGDEVEVLTWVPADELASDEDAQAGSEDPAVEPAGPDEESWAIPSIVLLATLVLVGLAVIRYRWMPRRR